MGGTSSFYWMKGDHWELQIVSWGEKKEIKCLLVLAASLDILPDFNRLRTPFWLNKFGSSGTSGSAGSCNVGWFGPSGQGFIRSPDPVVSCSSIEPKKSHASQFGGLG